MILTQAADCKRMPAELTLAFCNQSDPIAPINLERHVVEERPAGERF